MEADIRRLDDDEVARGVAHLDGWSLVGGKLSRRYEFADFVAAIGFMMKAAVWAQALNHHPDWSNLYNVVRVDLETHDVGGISRLDLELAARMDALASSGLAVTVGDDAPRLEE
jgi:4a-hydroxytetrahydrobiopterin dehydratase